MSFLPLIFRFTPPSSRISSELKLFLLERASVLTWIQKQNIEPEYFADVLIQRVLKANKKIQMLFLEEIQKLLQETPHSTTDPMLSLFESINIPRSIALVLCQKLEAIKKSSPYMMQLSL